jgi:hypothetical protein
MDLILFAIIAVVIIFGPLVYALVLWANPDRRPWRRRAQNVGDTNREHVQRPNGVRGCTWVGATAPEELAAEATAAGAAAARAAGAAPPAEARCR